VVSIILFLNRFLRRPRVGGRESEDAYSRWEYEWGRELVKLYLEPAGDIGGKRVLDIGCGLGGKTVAYGEGGARETIGIDISLEHVKASHAFTSKADQSHHWAYILGDASAMPVKDAVIDTVIANDAMEHFSDPEGALAEIERVVTRGGAVWVFFTPHFSPLGSHLYDYIYMPWCHLLFSRRSIKGAIRRILGDRMTGASREEVRGRLNEIMRSYDEDLNHMSVRRFFRILRNMPGLRITFRRLEPAKFSFLRPLTRLPLVRELVTGAVICRLEKTG
jgi:SAM-dependent methyltransferase